MGNPRATLTRITSSRRRQGTPKNYQPRRAEWHPLDASNRLPCPIGSLRQRPAITACQEGRQEGVLENILQTLAKDLKEQGKLDLSECFIDGFFVATKKGKGQLERPSRAKIESPGNGRPHWPSSRYSH